MTKTDALYVVILELIDREGIDRKMYVFNKEEDQELCYQDAFSKLKVGTKEKNLSWFTIDLNNVKEEVKYFNVK